MPPGYGGGLDHYQQQKRAAGVTAALHLYFRSPFSPALRACLRFSPKNSRPQPRTVLQAGQPNLKSFGSTGSRHLGDYPDWAQDIRTMAADSDYQKIAEHALAMLKAVYLREGPDAAVSSAKYMVEAAAIVIANELGLAETRRFLHFVGVRRGQEH